MGQLEDMSMLIRIVDAGSISKAAEQLGIAKSAVSRRLNELEKRLDTQLLSRTTRKCSLTETGTRYYLEAKNIVQEVEELNEQTKSNKTLIEGILRISTPLSFGLMHLSKVIDDFAKRYPNLEFQIDFSDKHIDLIEEGYELAIRIGNLQDSSHQAKRLTPINHLICASPTYLTKHGTPCTPAELANHSFLKYGGRSDTSLEFISPNRDRQIIELSPKVLANNGDFLKAMTISGHGITYLPSFLAYQEISEGKLVVLLPEYKLPQMHAYAVYPKNRFLAQRYRALIDFIAQKFGEEPYWDKIRHT